MGMITEKQAKSFIQKKIVEVRDECRSLSEKMVWIAELLGHCDLDSFKSSMMNASGKFSDIESDMSFLEQELRIFDNAEPR